MECEAVLEAAGGVDWVAVLALAVSVLATALAILAAVRLEQTMRLGVEFHFVRSGALRVLDEKSGLRGGVLFVKPRGPGALYEVFVSAWPPDSVEFLGDDGKPMTPKELGDLSRRRLTADDDPFHLPYRLKVDRRGRLGPGERWVGLTWEQPGFFGGFVPGGWRVRVEGKESEMDQRWSRLLKKWVPFKRSGANPKKHPIYGSVLHPSGTHEEPDKTA